MTSERIDGKRGDGTPMTVYRPVMTTEEYSELDFGLEDMGFCIACGAEAYGVEPDARRYPCESCQAHRVYGLQELLLMGAIKFVGTANV